LGRQVDVPESPQRIISLCPSETETLAALVAPERLVGCTRYCKYPEALVSRVTKVGGTKQLDLKVISDLSPELVIAVKEENDKAQIDALADQFPVIILDPVDHETAALAGLKQAHAERVLYLIWRQPYMAAGKGTYIDAMLKSLGLVNAAVELEERYPTLDDTAIASAAPDIILAASEPFPFESKHQAELEERFPRSSIYFVDGEAFGWHGVRTLHVSDTLNRVVQDI